MRDSLKKPFIFLLLSGFIPLICSCEKDTATPPILTTTEPSEIAQTTVTSGGNITSMGGEKIIIAGICFSLSANPSVKNNHTNDGKEIGSFISNLKDLTPGTKYYIRAYAYNKAGIGYGNEITFTTNPVELPTLSTNELTSVKSNSVISGGNITNDGGGTITDRGICWSTSTAPSIEESHISSGNGIGSFISNITELSEATIYYVRAYATNSAGTSYGNELSFITLGQAPTAITQAACCTTTTGAKLNGLVNANNLSTRVTFEYGLTKAYENSVAASQNPVTGNNTTSVSASISGINPGELYHFRIKAVNSVGSAFGEDFTFASVPIIVPALNTTIVTSITTSSAISGGNITSDGGGSITSRGVCWGTSPSPTISNDKTSDGTGNGSFISYVNGLQAGTLYYIRSYATNSLGTDYGNELSFLTDQQIPIATPYFALPGTGVRLLVGIEVTIYGDALINVPIVNNLSVAYTCDIGSAFGNNYIIKPVSGDIGNHYLTILLKEGSSTITLKTITFTVSEKTNAGSLKVLRVGDSTLGGEIIGSELDQLLTSSNITYLGTQGITRKYEGYGGYGFKTFATNDVSPFRKAGIIDISAYFKDNLIAVPDIVYFRLGINDVFTYCTSDITDADITEILGNADAIIDAFLAYNSTLKIVVAMPSTCANYTTGWDDNYDETVFDQNKYIEIIHRFQSALVNKYAGGRYDERVDCSYEAIMLDRTNGYYNGLHPNESGYIDLGDGLAPYINSCLK
jgi:hypothetical protein